MGKTFRAALLILSAVLFSHASDAEQVDTSRRLWQPELEIGNTLFPSLVLATRNLQSSSATRSPDHFGDPAGLFGVTVIPPNDNTFVRISVTIDGLSEPSVIEATLEKAGHSYTVTPYLRYKSSDLWRIKQPFPTTATFRVSINNEPFQEVTENLSIRAVNDVPFLIQKGSKQLDTSFLFAAFVNENAPVTDEILRDALDHRAINQFVGYAGGEQEVFRQIFALWNSLQRRGVKYSNITTPSGESKEIYSQHVRMVDESFANAQANCVDGSVLLASLLYKIGMCPVLVKIPSHMFIGVYPSEETCKQKNLSDALFMETTQVGSINLDGLQRHWKFKTKNGYLTSTSYSSLLQAMESGRQTFAEAYPAIQLKQAGYSVLDIQKVRSLGITPITSAAAE